MRIHLDPVGGVSGDMFLAAVLDTFPELEDGFQSVLRAIGFEHKVLVKRNDFNNSILTGSQMDIRELKAAERSSGATEHQHEGGGASGRSDHHDHSHHHSHSRFSDIRALLNRSGLSSGVRDRALDIFFRLACAEGKVHGVAPGDVTFHEVGAIDSITDITLAAYLIDALGDAAWSMAALPMGAGRINSQHGILPLPAPATLLLLRGMPVFDDGIKGERVTPTGAAILSHLEPEFGGPETSMRLSGSGTGFGTAQFPGLHNVLRVFAFETAVQPQLGKVTVFEFEIDDQTPEDLAAGIERIREIPGVLDVLVSAVTGKKNRQAQAVRILGAPDACVRILDACFCQTTTLGVRYHDVARRVLERQSVQVDGAGVKIASRPNGATAKVEMDDLARRNRDHAGRAREAGELAEEALAQAGKGGMK